LNHLSQILIRCLSQGWVSRVRRTKSVNLECF
jgi:hypothetical protein